MKLDCILPTIGCRHLLRFACLLAVFTAVSCRQTENVETLLSASDSLMATRPDSALALLRQCSPAELQTPAQRAQYALLLTQAEDKNYIVPRNDSLIRIATAYYDSTGDNVAMQGKAHYYHGRVHQELKNHPATVREFLTALPLVERSGDHRLLEMLVGNLGFAYFQQDLLDKADSLYAYEEELLKQHMDSIHWVALLAQRADVCITRGKAFYPQAERFLAKAIAIAEEVDDNHAKIEVLASLGCLYNDMGQPQRAIPHIRRELTLQTDINKRYGIYLSLSDAYSRNGQLDSAVFYARKSLSSPDFHIKSWSCFILENIARQKGDLTGALHLKDQHEAYRDSAKLPETLANVLTAEKDVLLQQNEQKHRRQLSSYLYAVFVVLLASVSILTYRRIRRHRQIRLLRQRQNTLQQTITALQQRSKEHDGDREELQQLNTCLNELLEEKRRLCASMESLVAEKDKEIARLSSSHQAPSPDDLPAHRSIACQQLLALQQENHDNPDANKKLPEATWEQLLAEIDGQTHGFVQRLNEKYERLLKEDIHFCCLVRIGMKYADMADVFACTPSAIYKKRNAILRRMGAEKGSKLEVLLENIEIEQTVNETDANC